MTEKELSTVTQSVGASSLSVGEQFRQARENLGLTLDAAAKKATLRPNILEHIENNEFSHKKIPATFMKGYVRSYAKVLKLPESVWANAVPNFGDTPKHDFNRTSRADSVTNPHSNSRWVGYLTTFVVLAVVGMTALWWWENYQQSNNERESLVQNYAPATTENTSSASTAESNVSSTSNNIPTLEVASNNQGAPTAVNVEKDAQPAVIAPLPQTEPVTATEPAESVQPVTASAVENSTVSQPESQPVAVNGDLQIEITAATSWITVKDAKRKNLAQKEYKQGEILSFDGQGPYALTIGAPANVKITYKGEAYPLKIDGRVARIKLQ